MVKIFPLLKIPTEIKLNRRLTIADITSTIDKNGLKELIQQKSDYRDKVIRLLAEICKDGTRRNLGINSWKLSYFRIRTRRMY